MIGLLFRNMPKEYFTPEGIKKLKEELDYLKNFRRKELAEKLEKALSYGDISENTEFQEAKDEQAFVEGRILELEEVLRNAVVLSKSKIGNETVKLGSVVVLATGKTKERYIIVGPGEADPIQGKISIDSPLGKALLARSKGEEISIDTPSGKKKYKIVKIA